jgi:pimeloyl-ACP methyl ester carboxylesterase
VTVERVSVLSDGPVSVLDHGGEGPLIVCVHGLEGSAYNWNLIAPHLVQRHRVVAPDLSGFGYTPPLKRGSTVDVNVEVVADVIRHFGTDALVIGNSMGGLITALLADRHPDLVRATVLVDPAAPVSMWTRVRPSAAARLSTPLIPWVGEKLIDVYRSTQSAEDGMREAFEFVYADTAALDPSVWEAGLEIAHLRRTQPWATNALVEAVQSIAPYVVRKSRFATVLHRVAQPTLLVHGTEDRLIQPATARWIARERPDWTTALFEGVGHVPMVEAPDRFLEVFDAWESSISASAA